jgi:hypothetical protein
MLAAPAMHSMTPTLLHSALTTQQKCALTGAHTHALHILVHVCNYAHIQYTCTYARAHTQAHTLALIWRRLRAAGIFGDVGMDSAPEQHNNLAQRENLLVATQRLYSHPLAVRLCPAVGSYAYTCIDTISTLSCNSIACRSVLRVFVLTAHRLAPAQHNSFTPCLAVRPSVHSHQSIITVMLLCIVPAGVLLQAQWERRAQHAHGYYH